MEVLKWSLDNMCGDLLFTGNREDGLPNRKSGQAFLFILLLLARWENRDGEKRKEKLREKLRDKKMRENRREIKRWEKREGDKEMKEKRRSWEKKEGDKHI